MTDLPQTIYVDGTPYNVLGGALHLARDGVVRDASGREAKGRCVDQDRARAWLADGTASDAAPRASSKSKKDTKRSPTKKTAAKKKGGR